ncbi:MAG: SGNH/GDSL hydrolase family protein [Oscillospiraceae bacterium]|nr:SGNH/GDSL hydrolase family protein [Oscillospiraceae bacterium]
MNLNLDTIRSVTTGAVRIAEKKDGIHFYRFTQAQEEYYRDVSNQYPKTFATAGVMLSFRTDSPSLDLKINALDVFKKSCREFFINLRNTYPDTPIFAICPIWRKICVNEYDCGPFRELPEIYQEVAKTVDNMTVIDAFEFVPHMTDYFADLTLHPNGAGFDRYFECLKPYFEDYRTS